MRWRWDQGRLGYFKYENIVHIARVLADLDGISMTARGDPLRDFLRKGTGLSFAPADYSVWRNYSRVFQCAMLATRIDGKLVVTDICRKLADKKSAITPDQYFNFLFSRFELPFPAFEDYDPNSAATYPFLAILKFVIVRAGAGATLADIFAYVVGNNCTGCEPLEFYRKLRPVDRTPDKDELRQIREMMVFMGQVSYLKWFDRTLYIDTCDIHSILLATKPDFARKRKPLAVEEFLDVCFMSETGKKRFEVLLGDREQQGIAVREGGRTFVTHGKIERSPLLRKKYFEMYPEKVCDVCRMHPQERYPWTDNILQLHHVFPLASTLNVNSTTTFLDDLVPLCPSCHRSVHIFYDLRLSEWGVSDFGSKKMARDVYDMAKREVRL